MERLDRIGEVFEVPVGDRLQTVSAGGLDRRLRESLSQLGISGQGGQLFSEAVDFTVASLEGFRDAPLVVDKRR